MQRLKEGGFSLVEVVLFLVLILIIGGTGYFVYQRSQDDPSSKPLSDFSQQIDKENDKTKESDPYEGWKEYSRYGVSFKYPADWTLKAYDDSQSTATELKSPDYSYPEGAGALPASGGKISVGDADYPQKGLSADNFEAKFLKTNPNSYKNFKALEINGNKVLRFEYDLEGSGIETIFFLAQDKAVGFHLDKAKNQPEIMSIYEKIVSSVKF